MKSFVHIWLSPDSPCWNFANLAIQVHWSKDGISSQSLWLSRKMVLYCNNRVLIYLIYLGKLVMFNIFVYADIFIFFAAVSSLIDDRPVCWLRFAQSCAGLSQTTNVIDYMADVGLISMYFLRLTSGENWQYAGIFIMRTFAIYDQNWIILIGLTALGVARVCVGLVSLISLYFRP